MFQNHYDIVIVGAGPAGLMAALESYQPSRDILILERMHMPALKLRLSGKGRCNITNEAPLREFLAHFGKNGRFLKFAFSEFFNKDVLHYFEALGIQFKLERGGRYFPKNDHATDVVNALLEGVKTRNIQLAIHTKASKILKLPDGTFRLTIHHKKHDRNATQKHAIQADKVVLATGGKSYPKTGSDGSGFELAAQLGHTVTPVSPSLVPLETQDTLAKQLQGLHVKNVTASLWSQNKKVAEEFGEMDFSDFGVSGPIILSLSRIAVPHLKNQQTLSLSIDFKPALEHNTLDQRLLREIQTHHKHGFLRLLHTLLPKKLIPVFLEKLRISGDRPLNQLTSTERKNLRMLLKDFRLDITGHRDFNHAIVTSGGISIHEISPKTMESKLVKGLYFAGEIIDVDADTGGFNLQAAFSTGWLAGQSM